MTNLIQRMKQEYGYRRNIIENFAGELRKDFTDWSPLKKDLKDLKSHLDKKGAEYLCIGLIATMILPIPFLFYHRGYSDGIKSTIQKNNSYSNLVEKMEGVK